MSPLLFKMPQSRSVFPAFLILNLFSSITHLFLLLYLQAHSTPLGAVHCTPVYEVVDYDTTTDNSTTPPALNSAQRHASSISPPSSRPSPTLPLNNHSAPAATAQMFHPTFHDLSSHAGTLFCSDGEYESDEVQHLLSDWLADTFLLQLKVIFLDSRGYSCEDFARDQDTLGIDSLPNVWKALMHHVMRHGSMQEEADSYEFFPMQPGSALVTQLHDTVNCNFVPAYCRALKHVGGKKTEISKFLTFWRTLLLRFNRIPNTEKIGVNRRALAAFAPSVARLYRTNYYQHNVELRNEEAAYIKGQAGNGNVNNNSRQQQLLNSSQLLKDPVVEVQVNAWVDFQLSALTSSEMSCHDLIQNYSSYARLATNVSELVELEAIGPLWISGRSGENLLQRQAHINWCRLVKDFASKAPMNTSLAAMRKSSPELITTISENWKMRTRTRFTLVTLIMLGVVGAGILAFIIFKAVGLYVVHRVDNFMQLRRQSAQELRNLNFLDTDNEHDIGGGNSDSIRLSARSPFAETRSL